MSVSFQISLAYKRTDNHIEFDVFFCSNFHLEVLIFVQNVRNIRNLVEM